VGKVKGVCSPSSATPPAFPRKPAPTHIFRCVLPDARRARGNTGAKFGWNFNPSIHVNRRERDGGVAAGRGLCVVHAVRAP
jgi:hypothetical protein